MTEEMEDGQMGQKQVMYFAGIPVPPDVELLLDKVDVSEGNRIPYWEIERLLGIRRDGSRWRTVVSGWRKRLEAERVVQLICDRGKAFVVANPPERVVVSTCHVKRMVNSAARAAKIAMRTPEADLGAEDKLRRAYVIGLTDKLASLVAQERSGLHMALSALRKAKALPSGTNNGKK